LTINNIAGVLLSPVGGKMADHCGRRNILLFNALMYTISVLLLCLSTNIIWFCFFYFLWAIPRGLNPPVLALYLTENLPS